MTALLMNFDFCTYQQIHSLYFSCELQIFLNSKFVYSLITQRVEKYSLMALFTNYSIHEIYIIHKLFNSWNIYYSQVIQFMNLRKEVYQ